MASLLQSLAESPTVLQFDTMPDALEAARKDPPDLFVCGATTGAMLGPGWIQHLVDAIQPAKVLVIVRDLDRASCAEAQRAGAWGHLPLTSSAELTLAAIRLILAGGTYFPAVQPVVLGDDGATEGANGAVLSRRQHQVLAELEKGRANKDIATSLGISVPTVKLHVQAILKALGATNRTQAVKLARDSGLTP